MHIRSFFIGLYNMLFSFLCIMEKMSIDWYIYQLS